MVAKFIVSMGVSMGRFVTVCFIHLMSEKQMIMSLAPGDKSNPNPIPRCRGFVAMRL